MKIERVAAQLGDSLPTNNIELNEYSDRTLIEALSTYEQDWASALPLFERYLSEHPESILALRYLTKLYLWKGKSAQARALVSRSKSLALDNNVELAYALFNAALIDQTESQFRTVLGHLNEAEQLLSKEKQWLLKSRIAEAKGHLWIGLKDIPTAIKFFEQALIFNQLIQSPIGMTTIELHMSEAYLQAGNMPEALVLFRTAKQRIEDQNLLFLYSMLADFEQRIKRENI